MFLCFYFCDHTQSTPPQVSLWSRTLCSSAFNRCPPNQPVWHSNSRDRDPCSIHFRCPKLKWTLRFSSSVWIGPIDCLEKHCFSFLTSWYPTAYAMLRMKTDYNPSSVLFHVWNPSNQQVCKSYYSVGHCNLYKDSTNNNDNNQQLSASNIQQHQRHESTIPQ